MATEVGGINVFILSYMLPFLVTVNVIVFIHSAGHFIGARLLRVGVDEVSLGLGPKLFGFSRNNVSWKVCWLPVGGYVRARTAHDDDGTYVRKIIVSLFGPAFSAIYSLIIFFVLFTTKGIPVVDVDAGEVTLVTQSFGNGVLATMRTMAWTWTTWSNDATLALPSLYDTPTLRLICVSAIWSSKFGILNLLPVPKFDGWKILGSILTSILGVNRAELTMKWLVYGIITCVALAVVYATWSDMERLISRF